MTFLSPEFETIDRKDMGDHHELLKLRSRERGLIALVLTSKDASGGAFFGGHNWAEIGQHPGIVEEYFRCIKSIATFHALSATIRSDIQQLIEEDKI